MMIRDRLESLSHSPDNIGTNTVSEDAALTSIAISLKRIAKDGEGQLNVGADVNANVSLNG